MPYQQKKLCQQPQLPFNLLCCSLALPSTFTYIAHFAHLLPNEAISKPFQKPLSIASTLTPFLTLLATNTTPPPPVRLSLTNPYILLIQAFRSTPLSFTYNANTKAEIQQESSEPRYFAILTPGEEDERLKEKSGANAMVKEQVYVEVEKAEAEIMLRVPGCGRENIGDGETWTKVEGVEKIWCEECKIWWEFRVWVREL
jgi:hypothetical protein